MTTIRRTSLVSTLVVVLAGIMLVVGATGWWMARDAQVDSPTDNLAVIDAKATAEVQSEVSRGLTQVLSYDYADPARTTSALDAVLTGAARKQYDTLFAALQERAPGQQLVLTAEVQGAAVENLTADSAKLLVFLDQSSQRSDDKEASVSAAQLAITAKKVKGAWLITRLKPL
jgi:Mce-associated membrane protein